MSFLKAKLETYLVWLLNLITPPNEPQEGDINE